MLEHKGTPMLTLAISVNVTFILGAVFVPNLWSVVAYLFPVAIATFLAIGIYALSILSDYFTRIFIKGDFKFSKTTTLPK